MLIRKYALFFLLLASSLVASNTLLNKDTLKICALRVEFVEDSNSLTTGTGKMWVDSVTTDKFAIDPCPHDKAYFEDQISAVSNYFKTVSKNKLTIIGNVYPREEKAAYQLPQKMAYYNPNSTDELINEGLSKLFLDAVSTADAAEPKIGFAQYDLIVIFHAGVGKDISLVYDETSQDIPSLYISESFLKESLGNDFEGVRVNDGSLIKNAIILPETENQDGTAIALTGIFASNIGSALGFYDLFSPSKQRTGIGRFGLMDFGLMNLNGLAPSFPSAFTRELAGWDTPHLQMTPQEDIQVARLGSSESLIHPTLYKIPINEDEYFLVEYRGNSYANVDSEFAALSENRDTYPSYMELLQKYYPNQIEISENGVLLSMDDYDLGIGGSGILIWHIDQKIIREKGEKNQINDDPEMRAVDLEEADAAQDIGHVYGLLDAGYQKELGWLADFWYQNRTDALDDFERYKNEFSSFSFPNTASNRNGAKSHISIYNFGDNRTDKMRFSYKREFILEGFPIQTQTSEPIRFAYVDIEGKDGGYFITLNANGSLCAFDLEGKSFVHHKKIIDSVTARKGKLSFLDIDRNGKYEKLLITAGKMAKVFLLTEFEADSMLAEQFTLDLPAEVVASPAISSTDIIMICENDSVYTFDFDGNHQTKKAHYQGAPYIQEGNVVASPNPNLGYGVMFYDTDGSKQILKYLSEQKRFEVISATSEEVIHSFGISDILGDDVIVENGISVVDIDGNGTNDILINTGKKLFALNANGTLVDDFFFDLRLDNDAAFVGAPLAADINNDGLNETFVAASDGKILVYNRRTKVWDNFPLMSANSISVPPILGDFDKDGKTDIAIIGDKGDIYAYSVGEDKSASKIIWPMENLNLANNLFLSTKPNYIFQGSRLMPKSKAYNYPNPANKSTHTTIRYYLNENAEVKIKIFDAAGFLVDELTGPGVAKSANEALWDVNDIASGVYLARVEAKSASKTENVIIKIMIVQ
jgi:M6 family metalloprotease-like protein